MIWIILMIIGFIMAVRYASNIYEGQQSGIVQRDVENLEREAFIKKYARDFGTDSAAEFWELYH